MATVQLGAGEEEKPMEAKVTAADQKKINQFARLNNRLEDVKSEMARLKKESVNLEYAEDEILMMDDAENATIPFKFGNTFIEHSSDALSKRIDDTKVATEKAHKVLEEQAEQLQAEMKQLKVDLYAKFGNTINLEPEGDE